MESTAPIIAVVDDELSVRIMLGRLLRLGAYRVTSFATGEEFLASLAASRPACVILDVHMPGLSGFDVESQMHAMQTRIPIVFITASDESELDWAATEANGVRLLRKPFGNADLLEAIAALLGGKQST